MFEDFTGKRVLITGAAKGVGRQLALDFARAGAQVVINFLSSEEAANQAIQEIEDIGGIALAVKADISDRAQVLSMFEEIDRGFGGLDILVNNAGLNRDRPFLEMSEQDWDQVLSTNLKGPFLCSQEAAKRMGNDNGGRIINISAVTSVAGRANAANYASSKGGLNALTRCLAVELGPNITCNAIILGFLDSPLVREVFTAEQIAYVEEKLPSGKMGTFEELSRLVQYLASPHAGFVTGQLIGFDGGHLSRLP